MPYDQLKLVCVIRQEIKFGKIDWLVVACIWGLTPLQQLSSYHGIQKRTRVSWLSHTRTNHNLPKPPKIRRKESSSQPGIEFRESDTFTTEPPGRDSQREVNDREKNCFDDPDSVILWQHCERRKCWKQAFSFPNTKFSFIWKYILPCETYLICRL